MSSASPRRKPESVNQSSNDISMATITSTTTRQQLRGDYSLRERGSGSKSNSTVFPTSQLPRNGGTKPTSSGWGMGASPATSEGDKSTWTGSWSKIQNIASTVLGNAGLDEEEEEERKRRIRIAERRRRAGLDTFVGGKGSGSAATTASVASNLRSRVGGGTAGEGDTSLRARGRRKVEDDETKPRRPQNISAVTSTSITTQPLHKRSTSPNILSPQNRASSSPPSTDRGDDTLAYVHKVRPTDTLEGVVIMFNIHPSALRRANRLWMGDSIQWRKELYLPVDECLVKGRPLTKEEEEEAAEEEKKEKSKENSKSESDEVGLLGLPENEVVEINGTRARRKVDSVESGSKDNKDKLTQLPPPPPDNNAIKGEDTPYRHHSFVMISGIGKVEIGRLSRNRLSHFPPRKGRGRGLSASSTAIPEDIGILDSSVFRAGGKVSEAYTGFAGTPMGAGGEIPTFGQMINQVARETRDGVENVGSLVEGFVRKMVVKVGEMARDGTEAAIELAEHVGSASISTTGERGDRGRIGEEGFGGGSGAISGDASHGAGSARDRPAGSRGLRGRVSNVGSSAESSRVGSRAGSLTRKDVGVGRASGGR